MSVTRIDFALRPTSTSNSILSDSCYHFQHKPIFHHPNTHTYPYSHLEDRLHHNRPLPNLSVMASAPPASGPPTTSHQSTASRRRKRRSRVSGSGSSHARNHSTSTSSAPLPAPLPSTSASSPSIPSTSTNTTPAHNPPNASTRSKSKRSSSTAELADSRSMTELSEAGAGEGSGSKDRGKKRKRKRPSEPQPNSVDPVASNIPVRDESEHVEVVKPRERAVNQEALPVNSTASLAATSGEEAEGVPKTSDRKKDKGKGREKKKGKESIASPSAANSSTLDEDAVDPIIPSASTANSAGPTDALRERANRMRENEGRERELVAKDEEIKELREGLSRMKKELEFKNSELVSQKETISTVKHSLTCSICLELMYQPFLISPCGHTACFTCLLSWFLSPPPGEIPAPEVDAPPRPPKKNKTCPNCRTSVQVPPTPIYFIKDLVSSIGPMLVLDGGGLGPPVEEKKDEDIWAGIFKKKEPKKLIRDDDDGVERCGDCGFEVDDGLCTGCGRDYFDSDDEGNENSDDDSLHDMLYGDHEHLDEDGNPIDVEDAEGFQFGEDSDDGERSEDESVLSGDWLVRDDEPANEDERTDEEGGELISNPEEVQGILLSRGLTQPMLEHFTNHALTSDGTIMLRLLPRHYIDHNGIDQSQERYHLTIYPDEPDLEIDSEVDPQGMTWIKERLFRGDEGRMGKRWLSHELSIVSREYSNGSVNEGGRECELFWCEEELPDFASPETGDSEEEDSEEEDGRDIGGATGRIAARLGRRSRVVELDSEEDEEQRVAPGPRWGGAIEDSDEEELPARRRNNASQPIRRGPIVLSDSDSEAKSDGAPPVPSNSHGRRRISHPSLSDSDSNDSSPLSPPSSPPPRNVRNRSMRIELQDSELSSNSGSASDDDDGEQDEEVLVTDNESDDTRSRLRVLRERFQGVQDYEGGADDGGDLLGHAGSDDDGEGERLEDDRSSEDEEDGHSF